MAASTSAVEHVHARYFDGKALPHTLCDTRKSIQPFAAQLGAATNHNTELIKVHMLPLSQPWRHMLTWLSTVHL